MELVLTWFNIAFNITAILIGLRVMFCLEEMREAANEMKQLLAELRDEKNERLELPRFVRKTGSEADS